MASIVARDASACAQPLITLTTAALLVSMTTEALYTTWKWQTNLGMLYEQKFYSTLLVIIIVNVHENVSQ